MKRSHAGGYNQLNEQSSSKSEIKRSCLCSPLPPEYKHPTISFANLQIMYCKRQGAEQKSYQKPGIKILLKGKVLPHPFQFPQYSLQNMALIIYNLDLCICLAQLQSTHYKTRLSVLSWIRILFFTFLKEIDEIEGSLHWKCIDIFFFVIRILLCSYI